MKNRKMLHGIRWISRHPRIPHMTMINIPSVDAITFQETTYDATPLTAQAPRMSVKMSRRRARLAKGTCYLLAIFETVRISSIIFCFFPGLLVSMAPLKQEPRWPSINC